MHMALRAGGGLLLALAVGSCASTIEVRTIVAPEASLTTQRTFRLLDAPVRRDGRPTTGADDPMVNNSIANRALRERITRAFTARGYQLVEREPDLVVAFYASAREALDVAVWDYGFPVRSRWPRPMYQQVVTEVTEGSVVVDVIDPRTQELLWRGEGRARLSSDPAENVKELARAAEKVVRKYPAARR
jgi:hypothetical protein